MIIKYYKHWAESELGEGFAYMEVIDDIVTKQVEAYGDEIFWAEWERQKDDRFLIADQAASVIGLDAEFEISYEEFQTMWLAAHRS